MTLLLKGKHDIFPTKRFCLVSCENQNSCNLSYFCTPWTVVVVVVVAINPLKRIWTWKLVKLKGPSSYGIILWNQNFVKPSTTSDRNLIPIAISLAIIPIAISVTILGRCSLSRGAPSPWTPWTTELLNSLNSLNYWTPWTPWTTELPELLNSLNSLSYRTPWTTWEGCNRTGMHLEYPKRKPEKS